MTRAPDALTLSAAAVMSGNYREAFLFTTQEIIE